MPGEFAFWLLLLGLLHSYDARIRLKMYSKKTVCSGLTEQPSMRWAFPQIGVPKYTPKPLTLLIGHPPPPPPAPPQAKRKKGSPSTSTPRRVLSGLGERVLGFSVKKKPLQSLPTLNPNLISSQKGSRELTLLTGYTGQLLARV